MRQLLNITPAERKRREEALNYALASVRMSGFKLSKVDEAHARRFVDGGIDLAELMKVRDSATHDR